MCPVRQVVWARLARGFDQVVPLLVQFVESLAVLGQDFLGSPRVHVTHVLFPRRIDLLINVLVLFIDVLTLGLGGPALCSRLLLTAVLALPGGAVMIWEGMRGGVSPRIEHG